VIPVALEIARLAKGPLDRPKAFLAAKIENHAPTLRVHRRKAACRVWHRPASGQYRLPCQTIATGCSRGR
jgi:hypothetical protein